jgi:hypothetical protein
MIDATWIVSAALSVVEVSPVGERQRPQHGLVGRLARGGLRRPLAPPR